MLINLEIYARNKTGRLTFIFSDRVSNRQIPLSEDENLTHRTRDDQK